jgi:membrane associated rhomboid family serine protease
MRKQFLIILAIHINFVWIRTLSHSPIRLSENFEWLKHKTRKNNFHSLNINHLIPFEKKNLKPSVSLNSVVEGLISDFFTEIVSPLKLIMTDVIIAIRDFLPFVKTTIVEFSSLPRIIRNIAIVQIVIWIAWQLYPKKMLTHFTFGGDRKATNRRWYTWLTSSISHADLLHLSMNLWGFLSLGVTVCQVMGEPLFLFTLLSSALTSSFASTLLLPTLPQGFNKVGPPPPSLGFSGVNAALAVLFTSLRPKATISVLGINDLFVEINAQVYLRRAIFADILMIAFNQLRRGKGEGEGRIHHGAHLAGYLWGFLLVSFLCSENGALIASRSCRRQLCG